MSECKFKLQQWHLDLMKRLNFDWCSEYYEGAPWVDPKRPYGNSDIVTDIAEITGMVKIEGDDEDFYPNGTRDNCLKLHKEMQYALEIITSLQTFELGNYEREYIWSEWKFIKQP